MLDRPYLGQKTHDVLSVLDWLTALGHSEVHLVAKGWGALAGALASVLHPAVRQVTLKHALTSYRDVAETEDYAWPLAALLPNVLAQFDLPDCYRALATKGLRIVEPWGAAAG
jgi:pimeloyl-ACP methyl ester carboxylesterase